MEQWNYGIAIMLSNNQVCIYIIDSSHTIGTLRSHNNKYFNFNRFATLYLVDKYENNYLIYEFILFILSIYLFFYLYYFKYNFNN